MMMMIHDWWIMIDESWLMMMIDWLIDDHPIPQSAVMKDPSPDLVDLSFAYNINANSIDVKNLEKGIKNLKKPGFNPKNKKP